jgi:hypothetical protein
MLAPAKVSAAIDAAKRVILALGAPDRAFIRAWVLRWIDSDGAILVEDRPHARNYVYPKKIDWDNL